MQREDILSLYPLERAVELTKAWFDANPPGDDPVILPDMSAEELETELADMLTLPADAPVEAKEEAEKMKQGFREIRGKKLSDLPPPTPEEDAAYFTEEAENGLAQLFSGWIQTLWLWHAQEGDGARLTDTLEPVGTVAEFEGKTWPEIASPPTPFSVAEIAELHAAFAAKLRERIDADPAFRVARDWTIVKDAHGYRLAP